MREPNRLARIILDQPILLNSQSRLLDLDPELSPLEEQDIVEMRSRFERLLALESCGIHTAGQKLFDRIADAHWSVEWNLPRWLGAVCGLTQAQQCSLLAVNIFGLGFVRVFDDRCDGEAQVGDEEAVRRLESLLYNAAITELTSLLGDDQGFWSQFDGLMQMWHRTDESILAGLDVLRMDPAEQIRLVDIGAPLFITPIACIALQNVPRDLEGLQAPIRHYLIGAVLYDHFKDWQVDLHTNRINLFVEAMLDSAPVGRDQKLIKSRIHQAFLERSNLKTYLQLVNEHLQLGAEAAHKVGMIPFSRHLLALEAEARESAEEMLEGIQRHLIKGMELFLPA